MAIRNVVGVDPGIHGAWCVLDTKLKIVGVHDFISFSDVEETMASLGLFSYGRGEVVLGIETQRGAPGRGWSANWTFGMNYGGWLAFADAMKFATVFVSAKDWYSTLVDMKFLLDLKSIVPRETQTETRERLKWNRKVRKKASCLAAATYWDEAPTYLQRVKDQDRADALLVARFAGRKRGL